MLNFYKFTNKIVNKIESPQRDCLINLHNPTNEEINFISDLLDVPKFTIIRMLDMEERSRIDIRDNYILSVVNVAFTNKKNLMDVIPIGILITHDYFLFVSTEDIDPLIYFELIDNKIDLTINKINILIGILYEISKSYIRYTREIIKKFEVLEDKLIYFNNNSDRLEALNLQKTLTFFNMSLYSNDLLITRIIKITERSSNKCSLDFVNINQELLEDSYTENKQAIEMVDTYSKIIIDLMNTIASIVANNQNNFLKFLTNITILLTIPMILSGFWGMNVKVPFEGQIKGFFIVTGISLVLIIFSLVFLWKKKLLK